MIFVHFQTKKNVEINKIEERILINFLKEKKVFQGELFLKFKTKDTRIIDFLELNNGNIVLLNRQLNQVEIWSPEMLSSTQIIISSSLLNDLSACFEYKPNKVMIGGKKVHLLNTENSDLDVLDVGHFGNITEFLQLPNDKFASASRDQTIKIWDLNGEIYHKIIHSHPIFRIVLHNNFIVTHGWNGKFKFFNIENKMNLEKEIEDEQDGHIYSIIFLTDGRMVSCSNDKTVRIFCHEKKEQTLNHLESVYSVVELENGVIVSGGYFQKLIIWKYVNGKFQFDKSVSTSSQTWKIKKFRKCLVSSHYDGTLCFWK